MECLTYLGFQSLIVGQIELSYVHGDLPQTLKKISQHLRTVDKHKRYLYKTLSYPVLLFSFLIIVVISIRQVLLPQLMSTDMMKNENLGLSVIHNSPYYIGSLFLVVLIMVVIALYLLKRKNSCQKALFFSKLPIYGKFYKKYLTAFFANEWGKLFLQGLEIKDVVYLMQTSNYTLLTNELAEQFEQAFLKGHLFHQQLVVLSFFLPEFSLIIQQGEMKGHLGRELILYSELCWQQLFNELEKIMNWIQPMVFLIIALLVVGVYASLLLPIYGNLEGFL